MTPCTSKQNATQHRCCCFHWTLPKQKKHMFCVVLWVVSPKIYEQNPHQNNIIQKRCFTTLSSLKRLQSSILWKKPFTWRCCLLQSFWRTSHTIHSSKISSPAPKRLENPFPPGYLGSKSHGPTKMQMESRQYLGIKRHHVPKSRETPKSTTTGFCNVNQTLTWHSMKYWLVQGSEKICIWLGNTISYIYIHTAKSPGVNWSLLRWDTIPWKDVSFPSSFGCIFPVWDATF